jgi:autotransporter-associated beta strand protein
LRYSITGSGTLIKTGSGMLTLTGTNDYSGGTLIQGGVLEAATPDALPGYGELKGTGAYIGKDGDAEEQKDRVASGGCPPEAPTDPNVRN